MEVLDQHQVTDDRMKSTDWTSMGRRILEAATIASAIHLDELAQQSELMLTGGDDAVRWSREESDGIG